MREREGMREKNRQKERESEIGRCKDDNRNKVVESGPKQKI